MPLQGEPREPWLDDSAFAQLDRELRALAAATRPVPAFLAAHDRAARLVAQSAADRELSPLPGPGMAVDRPGLPRPRHLGPSLRGPRYATLFGLAIVVCLVAIGLQFLPPAHTPAVVTAAPEVAGRGIPTAPSLAAVAATTEVTLHRPLAIPAAGDGACPQTPITRTVPDAVTGGIGDGPIYLAGPRTVDNVFTVPPVPPHSRAGFEAILLGDPAHAGPVLVRGREIGGTGSLRFYGPSGPTTELLLTADQATTLPSGWRRWSIPASVDAPGCYAIQIDGATFSEVAVIEIVTR